MATQYAFGKIVTDGLVLCLDAADRNSYVSGSTTWRDVAGSNNGTLINGPTFNATNGGSIVFDGVDDYVSGSVLVTPSFSVNFWFKPLQVRNFNPSFHINDWGNFVWHTTNTGAIYCGTDITNRFTPSSTGCGAGAVSVNIIQNFTYTFTSGTGSLYKNGNLLVTSNTQQTPVSASLSQPFYITSLPPASSYGNANVYSFQLYNRAISAQEVLQNFNAQKSRFGL
jgi:hypothetical protein